MVVGVSLPTALDQTNHIFSLFLLIKIEAIYKTSVKLWLQALSVPGYTRCCRIARFIPSPFRDLESLKRQFHQGAGFSMV